MFAQILNRFTNLYPVWLVLASLLALWHPPALHWFSGQWIVWAISVVMLGMGFTLTIGDFRRLFRAPGSLALGFLAHYTIMPFMGWLLGRFLHLEPGFAVGLILVASCPSGTASNVVSYLDDKRNVLQIVQKSSDFLTMDPRHQKPILTNVMLAYPMFMQTKVLDMNGREITTVRLFETASPAGQKLSKWHRKVIRKHSACRIRY